MPTVDPTLILSRDRRPGWRTAALLFLLCFVAYSLVFQGIYSWNSTSRFALTLSIVRSGTVLIDDYAAMTGDKARVSGGHFASDKAPGIAFLAVPVTALVDHLARVVGLDRSLVSTPPAEGEAQPNRTRWFILLMRIANIFTSALLSAAAVAAFYDLLGRLGTSPRTAAIFALLFGLGTPQWGWSTIFFGHAAAGALLVLGLWAVVRLTDPKTETRFRKLILAYAAGTFLGSAVVTEFTTVPAIGFIGLFALWRLRHNGLQSLVTTSGMVLVAAAVPLCGLATYNQIAFGSPLHLGYASVVGFAGMQTGFFGIGLPRLDVLVSILFDSAHGLLWLAPVLILFPWAVLRSVPRYTDVCLVSVAVVLTYLVINSGYAYWDGGASTGPRHVVPSLAFAVLPIALTYDRASARMQSLVLSLGAFGVFANMVAATTNITAPNPVPGGFLITHLLQQFLDPGPGKVFLGGTLGQPHVALLVYLAVIMSLTFLVFRSLPAMSSTTRKPPVQAQT